MSEQTDKLSDDPFDLEIIVGHFRDGLKAFIGQGDRDKMIATAAAHAQRMDEPVQQRLADHWARQREKLAQWDL